MKTVRTNKQGETLECPVRETPGDISGTESGTDDGRSPRVITTGGALTRLALSEKFMQSLRQQLKSEFREKLAAEHQQQDKLDDNSVANMKKETPVFQVNRCCFFENLSILFNNLRCLTKLLQMFRPIILSLINYFDPTVLGFKKNF